MKSIGRRKFLLGASGSAMALPWLEMHAADPKTKKDKEPPLRFASFYSPMGFVRDHFFPEKGDSDFLVDAHSKPPKECGEQSFPDHGTLQSECERGRCSQPVQLLLPLFG